MSKAIVVQTTVGLEIVTTRTSENGVYCLDRVATITYSDYPSDKEVEGARRMAKGFNNDV